MSHLTNRAELKRQVLAAVIVFLRERVSATGQSPLSFDADVEAAFPGLPGIVLYEAQCALLTESEDAWWDRLAATIEGEIVRNALTKPAVPARREVDRDPDLPF